MNINGPIQNAQYEIFTSGTLPSAAAMPWRTIYTTDTQQILVSDGVIWVPFNSTILRTPTRQIFLTGSGTYGLSYYFSVASANASAGATYTNNAATFTVVNTIAGSTTLLCTSTGAPATSGVLTKSGGVGDATINFSSFTAPLYQRIRLAGAGGGGGGGGNGNGANGTDGAVTTFGALTGNGGLKGTRSTGAGATAGDGGVGGTATGGNILNINGSAGTGALSQVQQLATNPGGGNGGATPFAGAGSGTSFTSSRDASANTGSGGAGGSGNGATSTNSSGGGGGGAGGYVEHIQTAPAAIYPYSIGAKGTGGAAGTNGRSGSNGADGIIIVEEFYQ